MTYYNIQNTNNFAYWRLQFALCPSDCKLHFVKIVHRYQIIPAICPYKCKRKVVPFHLVCRELQRLTFISKLSVQCIQSIILLGIYLIWIHPPLSLTYVVGRFIRIFLVSYKICCIGSPGKLDNSSDIYSSVIFNFSVGR